MIRCIPKEKYEIHHPRLPIRPYWLTGISNIIYYWLEDRKNMKYKYSKNYEVITGMLVIFDEQCYNKQIPIKRFMLIRGFYSEDSGIGGKLFGNDTDFAKQEWLCPFH